MRDVVKVAITKSAAFRLTKTGTRCKIYDRVAIVLPELQRFYGRAIVIITPVEMPIRDINRPLSIIIFVLYLSVYRVVLGRIYD
jgi:hypothetical protein